MIDTFIFHKPLRNRAIFWITLILLGSTSLVSCSLAGQSQATPTVEPADSQPISAPENQTGSDTEEAALQTAPGAAEPTVSLNEPALPEAGATATLIPAPTPTADPSDIQSSISSALSANFSSKIVFEDPTSGITSLAFSPDSQSIALALADGAIHLIQTDGSSRTLTLEGHSAEVRDLAFSPDGSTFASAGEESTVKIWNSSDGSLVREINTSFVGRALAVEFSPDGRKLAIGGHKCFVALYNVWSGILHRTLVQPGCSLKTEGSVNYYTISFSRDGSEIITADGQPSGSGGSIQSWSLDPVAHSESIKSLGMGFSTMDVSPDGEWIAASLIGSSNILLISLADGRILDPFEGHEFRVNSLAFSPDGRLLVSGSTDGTVRLWDVGSGLLLRTLEGDNSPVNVVAFSPDGTTIASGSDDGNLILWSLSSNL